MFMNDDTEFQELIRAEFLLPYLTNEFLRIYAKENAGGLLFAFLKDNGRLRSLVCGDAWRRCTASLLAQFLKLDAAHFFTSTSFSVPGACGMEPTHALKCCKCW
jgi:hypothetical protein